MGVLLLVSLLFDSVLCHDLAKRQAEANESDKAEPDPENPEDEPIQLGEILGLLFLVSCILYCIGIGYKVVKIMKGTYVEEEPVFLKYK